MNFISNLFTKKNVVIPIQEPNRFPDFNNIPTWMEEKVNYFAVKYPESLFHLFCPSMADYLPLTVTAGTSKEQFFKHIETYTALKNKYPEAVKKAKENIVSWNIFNGGPQEDYHII